jgi:hypothetical protein
VFAVDTDKSLVKCWFCGTDRGGLPATNFAASLRCRACNTEGEELQKAL